MKVIGLILCWVSLIAALAFLLIESYSCRDRGGVYVPQAMSCVEGR